MTGLVLLLASILALATAAIIVLRRENAELTANNERLATRTAQAERDEFAWRMRASGLAQENERLRSEVAVLSQFGGGR